MAFTCPRCESVSHHPDDERHGYCGNCHAFTASAAGSLPGAGITGIIVDGIVSHRDKEPYVRIEVNGEKAQMSIAEAHKVAKDLMTIAGRTEADAMVFRFFSDNQFPPGAAAALMQDFRYFRQVQDDKKVQETIIDPDSGETIRRTQ